MQEIIENEHKGESKEWIGPPIHLDYESTNLVSNRQKEMYHEEST